MSPVERQTPVGANDERHPKVSVVIPAYRIAPFIAATLDSVFNQKFNDFEVIVINDGSPDTAELERVLEPYLKSINYLRQENRGAGAARNAGLRAAKGDLIAFLDGDDLWLPNYLSEQIRFIESDGGYDWVYANATHFGESPDVGLTYMDTCPSSGELTCESLLDERCHVITSGVVARREAILEVGLFDETIKNSQDFDLWVRLAKRPGARMNYQQQVLLQYRHHAGSLAADQIKSVEGQLRVLEKTARRSDLTPAERKAIARISELRKASVAVARGKRYLLEGNFGDSIKSFKLGQEYFRSWKLGFVLLWLRIAPKVFQRIYERKFT